MQPSLTGGDIARVSSPRGAVVDNATSNTQVPLRNSIAAAYGAPAIMLAALSLTFYIYLPKFFVDDLGFDLSVLGLIVLVSRLWDAVTDPAIGALSDRTRTRWGRRRPWMVVAAVPLAASFYLLAAPPVAPGTGSATILSLLAFVFFLTWTAVTVPYESLGPEISFDYDERNRLFGIREASVLTGTVIAAGAPALFPPGSLGLPGYGVLSIVYGIMLFVAVGICVSVVKERRWREGQHPSGAPWAGWVHALTNRPFVILLVGYSIYSLGGALAATVFLFFVEHVIGSTLGPIMLVLYLVTGIVFMPLWVFLARRWEKRAAWILALLLNSAAFVGVSLLGQGDIVLFGILIGLTGIGLGGAIAIPPSMQADVIDYDEWTSGERREGQYVGLWALAKKFAMAMSAGLALPILDWSGYLGGTAAQPDSAIIALKWLLVGGPLLCNMLTITIAVGYPIDRATHAKMREQIDTSEHAITELETTARSAT